MSAIDEFKKIHLLRRKLLITTTGSAWNSTNLKGKNTIQYRHKSFVTMVEHFNKRHIHLAETAAIKKYSNYKNLRFMVTEVLKRGELHKQIERSIIEKYRFVPNECLRREYNPLEAYRLFRTHSYYVNDTEHVVYFMKHGSGANTQLIYCVVDNPWVLESSLLKIKQSLSSPIDDASVLECQKRIDEIEKLAETSNIISDGLGIKIKNKHDMNDVLEIIAEKCINAALKHNVAARQR